MILAMDSAAGFCSVALLKEQAGLKEGQPAGQSLGALPEKMTNAKQIEQAFVMEGVCLSEPLVRGHSEYLLPLLIRLLKQAGFENAQAGFQAVEKIAVITGPGSFTGLRAGLAAARGLALAIRSQKNEAEACPLVGLSALYVRAVQVARHFPRRIAASGLVHSLVPGRPDQVFHQAFRLVAAPEREAEDALPVLQALNEARSFSYAQAREFMAAHPGTAIGPGAVIFDQAKPEDTEALDMLLLAALAKPLSAEDYPALPLYLREADAVVSKPFLI